MSSQIRIDIASENQIGEIMEIERANFTPPWSEGSMLREIYSDDSVVLVITDAARVAGFCVLRVAGAEAELLNLAVDAAWRRRGFAVSLLRSLFELACSLSVTTIFLEVRQSNAPAIALYEKLGFNYVGLRKDYYDEPAEDAILMRCDL
jgi:ribosomal-protein-alanine N-acetyltransferase